MQHSEIRELAEEIRGLLCNVALRYPEFCIGRVHQELHEAHMAAYTPTTLSIGPLHRHRTQLSSMDGHKCHYTMSFLQRTPLMAVEDYLKAMQGLEEKARRCYGQQTNLTSKEFKRMMLFDGCFIIELFLRFAKETSESGNDPIICRIGLSNRIKRDLVLFENQLPFFVLQCLFNISAEFNAGPSLIDLALHFFSDMIPGHKKVDKEKGTDLKHLLDLLRHSYAPTSTAMQQTLEDKPEVLCLSVTDLRLKAGIKFRKSKSGSLLDIKFHDNGCMEIPQLQLLNETETLLRNFIAFEQHCCETLSNAYITDYVSFMGSLVRNLDDIEFLCDEGIIEIQHPLSDPQCAVDLFASLTKDFVLNHGYCSRLCKRVNSHCIRPRRPWSESIENLVYDFLSFIYICIILMPVAWALGWHK